MTIEIERKKDAPVWYRNADSQDPWTQLIATYVKMLPGQEWDLSDDGVERKGALISHEVGEGGTWSNFISKIDLHEVRRLGTSNIYVHGK